MHRKNYAQGKTLEANSPRPMKSEVLSVILSTIKH